MPGEYSLRGRFLTEKCDISQGLQYNRSLFGSGLLSAVLVAGCQVHLPLAYTRLSGGENAARTCKLVPRGLYLATSTLSMADSTGACS